MNVVSDFYRNTSDCLRRVRGPTFPCAITPHNPHAPPSTGTSAVGQLWGLCDGLQDLVVVLKAGGCRCRCRDTERASRGLFGGDGT